MRIFYKKSACTQGDLSDDLQRLSLHPPDRPPLKTIYQTWTKGAHLHNHSGQQGGVELYSFTCPTTPSQRCVLALKDVFSKIDRQIFSSDPAISGVVPGYIEQTDDGEILVMEAGACDLSKLVQTIATDISSSDLAIQCRATHAFLHIASQLCHAIETLHHINPTPVHSDLRPANILAMPTGDIVLIDFGFSKHVDESPAEGCSPKYASPTQIIGEKTSKHFDYWAVGAILIEFLLQGTSFESFRAQKNINSIAVVKRKGDAIENQDNLILSPKHDDALIGRIDDQLKNPTLTPLIPHLLGMMNAIDDPTTTAELRSELDTILKPLKITQETLRASMEHYLTTAS